MDAKVAPSKVITTRSGPLWASSGLAEVSLSIFEVHVVVDELLLVHLHSLL